jgi:hypothetical protein
VVHETDGWTAAQEAALRDEFSRPNALSETTELEVELEARRVLCNAMSNKFDIR